MSKTRASAARTLSSGTGFGLCASGATTRWEPCVVSARGAAFPWFGANLGAWWSGLACQGPVANLYVGAMAVMC